MKKTTKRKHSPSLKIFIDPRDAPMKSSQDKFHILQPKIQISPISKRTLEQNALNTDRIAGNSRNELMQHPSNMVDNLTDDILNTINKKLVEIKQEQNKQIDKRDLLSIKLINSKDELRSSKTELESHKQMLVKLGYTNKKLETDYESLQKEFDSLDKRINEINRKHELTALKLQREIILLTEKKDLATEKMKTKVNERDQCESEFKSEKETYQELINEKADEIEELKGRLKELGTNEGFRMSKLSNETHSISIKMNALKYKK